MGRDFLDEIDWSRPWLAPLSEPGQQLAAAADWRHALNRFTQSRGLRNYRGLPIQFVPQSSLPPETPYEAHISASGCVPTRDNLHDFFNALVWLSFPRIKGQLNGLQSAAIADAGREKAAGQTRGRVRDAATIFDENAALLVCSDAALIASLRAHHWNELFIERRDAFSEHCEVWLFGHALMEKLVAPFKAITGHAWPILVDSDYFRLSMAERGQWLDRAVASQLTVSLSTADFSPLPVLGVPGWWAGQDGAFYADSEVFRPKRRRREG